MKYLATTLVFLATPAMASNYQICTGEFALCAASPATPTGNSIMVNTTNGPVAFPEAVAVCPVLQGPAIADVTGGNMKGSCAPPGGGKVWSLFAARPVFPQAPDWKPTKAQFCSFVVSPSTPMSNMFSFACTKIPGTRQANCYGPINESLSGAVVPDGTTAVTEAPVGATYPVSGPLP